MPRSRTKWSEDVVIAMTKQHLVVRDIAEALGYTPQYTSSVVYGHVNREIPKQRISEFLGISYEDN